jgi:hypothetical protein
MYWRGRVVMNLVMKLLVILTIQEKIEKARVDMYYVCLYSKTSLKKVHFCDDEPFRQTLSSKFVNFFL